MNATHHDDLLIATTPHPLSVDGQDSMHPAWMVHGKPEDDICTGTIPQPHHLLDPEMVHYGDQVQPYGLQNTWIAA